MTRRTQIRSSDLGVAVPVLAAGALFCAFSSCGGDRSGSEQGRAGAGRPGGGGRPVVVVSVPPLAWFVERLAGTRVDVSVMVPPGASPAFYEPTPRQMRTVGRAALYVAVGHPAFPFEAAWLDALVAAHPEMAVTRAGADCSTLPDDPHVWLSTRCARRIAVTVGRALGEALEEPPDAVPGRTARLLATVDSVGTAVARRLEPHRGRAFLVLHPALGYLAREFGLRQLAIASGPSGPGPAALGSIIRTAREAGIHTVFVQPQFSGQAARTVAAELPAGRVATIDPLARDWAAGMLEIARKLSTSLQAAAEGRRSASGPHAPVASGTRGPGATQGR